MEDQIHEFNNLPRSRTVPTGLPNHWVFGACHVDLNPSGDIVIAVHPQSRYRNSGSPTQVHSLPSLSAKADAIVPSLLSAFLQRNSDFIQDNQRFAPWTWSTLDADMAKAVQEALKKAGVRNELCKVGVCTPEELDILEETRAALFANLLKCFSVMPRSAVARGDGTRCHGCGLSRDSFFKPLMKCAGCSSAFYHSRECQKKDWTDHKPNCYPPGSEPKPSKPSSAFSDRGESGRSMEDPYSYYNTKASSVPAARQLMKSLNLEIGKQEGIQKPMRRLVLTGKDTPENLELLFGPTASRGDLKEAHQAARITVLLNPPPGSPSYVMNRITDLGAPSARCPRPASKEEQEIMDEVRDLRGSIRDRVGTGNQPSTDDMQHILVTRFGNRWSEKLQTYMLAVSTFDQGVPEDGYR